MQTIAESDLRRWGPWFASKGGWSFLYYTLNNQLVYYSIPRASIILGSFSSQNQLVCNTNLYASVKIVLVYQIIGIWDAFISFHIQRWDGWL